MGRCCSKCRRSHNRRGRYCLSCHAAYMREWRKSHPLTEEQRVKDNARSRAGDYKRSGKITVGVCPCGKKRVEMHHPDYSKPFEVQWLCRECHLDVHIPSRIAKRDVSREAIGVQS